ncbi:TetR/AcrR family transcriptional regulator [Lentzea sp.]|uniref:TetR/AcrR family transcriptional regulator n=1 Tax=Lentzea sp. TaxID=56099 RepID=UPI002CC39EDF|nr:TetR/AcrR family transcriptional regulator [Lentzea sp.]HUQ59455.1 TetR/AcrR family transcriptional regulator [Lentzea sp.]
MTAERPTVSRRERLRAQTLQEIEDVSFAIIDADGVHALSIAALARTMAMSAPAVYRYFPSREALITHLVTTSYRQLADAVREAAETSRRTPRTRVRLLVAAYRDWALRHPRRYGMLFGERAGDAPIELAGVTPLDQAMAALIDLLTAIPGSAPATSADRALDGQLRLWARSQDRPATSPRAALAAVLIWTRVHGIVSLELTGIFGNGTVEAQRLIDAEVDNAIRTMTGV